MSHHEFWVKEYENKAREKDPVAQSGRGRTFDVIELLHVVRQVFFHLKPNNSADLLDIGCGNGLIDIPLSAACRSVMGIDPVGALLQLARHNTSDCENVAFMEASGGTLPFESKSFDRILAWGVLQLLTDEEAQLMCAEIARVARPGCIIMLGSIPDVRRRDAILGPYLEDVRKAPHLEPQEKEVILSRNLRGNWYDPVVLGRIWKAWNGVGSEVALSAQDPNHDQRFHFLVQL